MNIWTKLWSKSIKYPSNSNRADWIRYKIQNKGFNIGKFRVVWHGLWYLDRFGFTLFAVKILYKGKGLEFFYHRCLLKWIFQKYESKL